MDRRILLFGRPPVPVLWKTLIVHTATTIWIVPKSGWYRIHVIGKGGNGGAGGNTRGTGSDAKSGGGGGGGSGGYAASLCYLRKGTQISCDISASATICTIKEDQISATCGNTGGNGTNSSGGDPGLAGSAAGGNLANTSATGSSGGYANDRAFIGTANNNIKVYSSYYGTGGTGGNFSALIDTSSYGRGGVGGRGAYYYKKISSSGGIDMNYTKEAAANGSAGGAAAIIIETEAAAG